MPTTGLVAAIESGSRLAPALWEPRNLRLGRGSRAWWPCGTVRI